MIFLYVLKTADTKQILLRAQSCNTTKELDGKFKTLYNDFGGTRKKIIVCQVCDDKVKEIYKSCSYSIPLTKQYIDRTILCAKCKIKFNCIVENL